MDLGIAGFVYRDLHDAGRLQDLYNVFCETLTTHDPVLAEAFLSYHNSAGEDLSPQQESELLVQVAPYVGKFIAHLFQVEKAHSQQAQRIKEELDTVFSFRTRFIQKNAARFKQQSIDDFDARSLSEAIDKLAVLLHGDSDLRTDREKTLAKTGLQLLDWYEAIHAEGTGDTKVSVELDYIRQQLAAETQLPGSLLPALAEPDAAAFINHLHDLLGQWAFVAASASETKEWRLFKQPSKTDFDNLVEHDLQQQHGVDVWKSEAGVHKHRDGFALTDPRYNQRETLYEVEHCIYCHERDTDSCSKGMRNKRSEDFKINPLGETIIGCPLGEKISEMHVVKRQGDNIAALAMVIIDNPMCPGTGHRICNDCMRGCIYQKTDPVNIPQIETNVLTDVLFMPFGFEIYSLLTRWNPLNVKRPYALPYNGKNVLVVGMGPAGYTMSHYLLNEGFAVAGIDALKIEPLDESLVGHRHKAPTPIEDFNTIYESLDERRINGFGGVAEYGITVRWDKNFLKVIYLNLLRRRAFECYGGIRFGGTLTIEDAWQLGFDHIAIASGAGKPTIIGLKNNMIRGIRKASDFLMALQLSGASKKNSLANLQVRLPAGVIGGGLTAFDTTTEVMAYYPVQVEKTLSRYEKLVQFRGEKSVRASFDAEELEILDEFLVHGRAIRAERARAEAAGDKPDFPRLINEWGGVTLFYRKGINASPAYRQNYEEINEALREGISLAENMSPEEAHKDEHGALRAVTFKRQGEQNENVEIPLRSLFIAAGTSPNTIYQQEHPNTFQMHKKFFQRFEPKWSAEDIPELVPSDDAQIPKLGQPAPFTSYCKDGRYISFYGDNHPVYAGNVVKAMASAKHGYPYIARLFEQEISQQSSASQPMRDAALDKFFNRIDSELLATVVSVNRLTPTIVEVIVKAPIQARKFQPGQFYRVQNFEYLAPEIEDTVLASEGLALTGAWVDKEKGHISLITLEMGSSSRLCALWQPGDPVLVMGVTGEPTELTQNQTVMLVGGGLGNAVQFSIGKALRALGNKVIYFAGYKHSGDIFKVDDIEAASDVIVWAVDPGPGVEPIQPTRAQDKSFVGNILDTIEAYGNGQLGLADISLQDVDRMIVIGSDRMMAAVTQARHGRLQHLFKPEHRAIGSINSPMQCMMKGVCAQCLCRHIDPETKQEYFVYSCSNQDQDLDRVDFENLKARLRQNSVQEKLSAMWLESLFTQIDSDEPGNDLRRSG